MNNTFSLTAKMAWTGRRLVEQPLIDCVNGRIAAIEPAGGRGSTADHDLGDALILPGFINAHAHLEYSFLHNVLDPGQPFPQWLGEMVRQRRETGPQRVDEAVRAAIEQATTCGTAAIFDIATRGEAIEPLGKSNMRAWAFLEGIGLDPQQSSGRLKTLETRLADAAWPQPLRPGISPHAPYTLSDDLARMLGDLARKRGLPLAIHLAETPEERQMLVEGRGPLAEMFRERDLLPARWKAPGIPPVAWAAGHGLLGPRTLAIHCNDVREDEIALLARSGATAVYCPRSHIFFRRPPHPIKALLAAAVPVAIGTDSLASNWSLDLIEELRAVRHAHPAIPATQLFAMIGAVPARVVGMQGRLGLLEPGAQCALAVVRPCPPGKEAQRVLEGVLEGEATAGLWTPWA